ncbi:hypothetical protein ACFL1V_03115 [Pseudomonadota bacterium]
MKRKAATFLITVSLSLIASQAWACTGFFKYEEVSGMNKLCYYDHLGSKVAINKKSYELCPISIRVPH